MGHVSIQKNIILNIPNMPAYMILCRNNKHLEVKDPLELYKLYISIIIQYIIIL